MNIKNDRAKRRPHELRSAFNKNVPVFILVLVAVSIAGLYWRLMIPRKDFYNELWAPAYLLVRGHSPYNTAELNPTLPAAWLPMAIGLFFPIGWLPETVALQVWFIFTIVEVCAIIFLMQEGNPNIYNTFALSLLCFFFPPVLNHINLGQFTITITLCWLFAIYAYEKERRWLSAFFIAVCLAKPHLGILPLIVLSSTDYARGGFMKVIFQWMRILAMCILLCIPLFVAYPNWIPDALESMSRNPIWLYPSLYILFERNFGVTGYFLWACSTILVIWISWYQSKKLPLRQAMYWGLALAPLVTPYVGSWDFNIILPLFISIYVNIDWKRKAFLWVVYWIAWYGMARVQMQTESHNHFFWWVPVYFVFAEALVTDWKVKFEQ